MDGVDQSIIEDLYRVFSVYERPVKFEGCGCESCSWADIGGREIASSGWNGTMRPIVEVDALGGDRPLQELEPDVLRPLTNSGVTDSGVFMHYLPRILELFVLDAWGWWPDEYSIIGMLSREYVPYTPWTEWPEPERAVIGRFLDAYGPLDEEED